MPIGTSLLFVLLALVFATWSFSGKVHPSIGVILLCVVELLQLAGR